MQKAKGKLLRVPAIAERLAVRESTVRKMIFERRLPTVRIGRAVAVPEEAVEALIEGGYRHALGRQGE